MNYEEALEWLIGKRSMTNSFYYPDNDIAHVMCAQADAAMMQQAYWVAKAHKEGLIEIQGQAATEKKK